MTAIAICLVGAATITAGAAAIRHICFTNLQRREGLRGSARSRDALNFPRSLGQGRLFERQLRNSPPQPRLLLLECLEPGKLCPVHSVKRLPLPISRCAAISRSAAPHLPSTTGSAHPAARSGAAWGNIFRLLLLASHSVILPVAEILTDFRSGFLITSMGPAQKQPRPVRPARAAIPEVFALSGRASVSASQRHIRFAGRRIFPADCNRTRRGRAVPGFGGGRAQDGRVEAVWPPVSSSASQKQ